MSEKDSCLKVCRYFVMTAELFAVIGGDSMHVPLDGRQQIQNDQIHFMSGFVAGFAQ